MKQMRIDPDSRVDMNTAACTEVIDNVRFDAMAAAIERTTLAVDDHVHWAIATPTS